MEQMNDKNILKMVAAGKFYANEDWQKRYEMIPVNERDNNPWWYLHGNLQSDVHGDKAVTTNCKTAGYSKRTVNFESISDGKVDSVVDPKHQFIYAININGEVPVEIEGVDKECIGFFWTLDNTTIEWKNKKYPFWRQRGLVCYADDEEACNYARERMEEKSSII